jgi:CDP-diacylglycerol--glycerol-3-phosphate 3-phosphatidyltransferase
MNLPNAITSIRIVLGPVFIVFFLVDNVYCKLASLVIVIGCEISDLLDGYVARKYNSVTTIGKLLDPLADSLCRFSMFLAFFALGYAQLWMLLVFFYRDSIVAWVRTIAATKSVIVSSRTSGKIKAWFQGVTIIAIVSLATLNYWIPVAHINSISFAMMTVTAVVTAYSGVDYFLSNLKVIRS